MAPPAQTCPRRCNARLVVEPAEKVRCEAIASSAGEARAAVEIEDFRAAMRALATLRHPVDDFFEKVLVNADDPEIRVNRLKLLDSLRRAALTVADFSRIGG